MSELESVTLDALRTRITGAFPQQIRACLDRLTDEQVWSRPNEDTNSIGNLVLHLTGSLNHYLNHLIGGMPYERDRDREFADRSNPPKAEVLARFDAMIAEATRVLDGLDPKRLNDPSHEPQRYHLLVEELISIATHIAAHAGQIVWITKMMTGDLGDVWMKAHKRSGAWMK